MSESKHYKCVNCGQPSRALYKTYGPSVLKLNKCEKCKGIVDKYIEYDPVIVMIDLVLVSREAQRHVIYNTDFKSYWKLFIMLMLLETYGMWRSDSLFNIAVNSVCDIQTNTSYHIALPRVIPVPACLRAVCGGWGPVPAGEGDLRPEDGDLFIWEKDFYIQFLSTFTGVAMFILTIHISMKLLKTFSPRKEVSMVRTLKAFSLGNVSTVLSVPQLVWGAHSPAAAQTRAAHYALLAAYSALVFVNVLTVLYECPMAMTASILLVSYCAKFLTTFYMTPLLRTFIT